MPTCPVPDGISSCSNWHRSCACSYNCYSFILKLHCCFQKHSFFKVIFLFHEDVWPMWEGVQCICSTYMLKTLETFISWMVSLIITTTTKRNLCGKCYTMHIHAHKHSCKHTNNNIFRNGFLTLETGIRAYISTRTEKWEVTTVGLRLTKWRTVTLHRKATAPGERSTTQSLTTSFLEPFWPIPAPPTPDVQTISCKILLQGTLVSESGPKPPLLLTHLDHWQLPDSLCVWLLICKAEMIPHYEDYPC